MAELLVRTQDNVVEDPVRDIKSWKRGMVITVQEDGWAWGKEELTNPLFLVVKIPGMSVVKGSVYLGNLIDPARVDDRNPLRSFRLDLDSAELAGKEGAVLLDEAALTSAKEEYIVVDPFVVG